MTQPTQKPSSAQLATAWIIVGIPLTYGIIATVIKALPLFQ